MIYKMGAEKVPHWFHVEGVKADITFGERYDFTEFGLNAYVLHTPGHSAGSCSVVIDGEIALAGDTIDGMKWTVFPTWGDDPAGIVRSWGKLLRTGCHTFHPAHGFPVSRVQLEKEYGKRVTSDE
jgi:glyoxylase-like metal-dependent hydrolase (beta-lactamase superfamily II)